MVAILADCEKTGNEVREDNRWLMVSCKKRTKDTYVKHITVCTIMCKLLGNQDISFVVSSALSVMVSYPDSYVTVPLATKPQGEMMAAPRGAEF